MYTPCILVAFWPFLYISLFIYQKKKKKFPRRGVEDLRDFRLINLVGGLYVVGQSVS